MSENKSLNKNCGGEKEEEKLECDRDEGIMARDEMLKKNPESSWKEKEKVKIEITRVRRREKSKVSMKKSKRDVKIQT